MFRLYIGIASLGRFYLYKENLLKKISYFLKVFLLSISSFLTWETSIQIYIKYQTYFYIGYLEVKLKIFFDMINKVEFIISMNIINFLIDFLRMIFEQY